MKRGDHCGGDYVSVSLPKRILFKLSGVGPDTVTIGGNSTGTAALHPNARNMTAPSGVFYPAIAYAEVEEGCIDFNGENLHHSGDAAIASGMCSSASRAAASATSRSKTTKELSLALRYLTEIVRKERREMYAVASDAFLDALFQYLSRIPALRCDQPEGSGEPSAKHFHFNDFLDRLDEFLGWIDDQCIDHFHSLRSLAFSEIQSAVAADNPPDRGHSNGLCTLKRLELTLRKVVAILDRSFESSEAHDDNNNTNNNKSIASHLRAEESVYAAALINCNDEEEEEEEDDPITRLLEQLRQRKFAKMKPKFPSLATPENIDDDDDDEDGEASEDDSGVHEEDERLESHGDSVEEKELSVKNTPRSGSPTNVEQLSNRCSARKYAKLRPSAVELVQSLRDRRGGAASVTLKVRHSSTPPSTTNTAAAAAERTVKCECVNLNAMRTTRCDAKASLDESVQQMDKKSRYAATHTEPESYGELHDLNGVGARTQRNGARMRCVSLSKRSSSTGDSSLPIRQQIRLYEKKSESDSSSDASSSRSGDVFFRVTTLACYVTLNDNLRYYEEQQRKRRDLIAQLGTQNLGATAAATASAPITPDYVNLRNLLQTPADAATLLDDSGVVLPTQFLDESEEAEIERSFCTPSASTSFSSSSSSLSASHSSTVITTAAASSASCGASACISRAASGALSALNPLHPQLLPAAATTSTPHGGRSQPTSGDHSILYGRRSGNSILESLDVSQFLVLRARDAYSKPVEVRGGPKTALIVYATQNCSLLYQEAFLVTYRSFVTSKELIQKLIRRYFYMSSEPKPVHQKAARQTFSVLVRVVSELCAIELTRDLVTIVNSFIYRLIRCGNYEFARILRHRLMEIIEEKSAHIRKQQSSGGHNPFYGHLSEPSPKLPSIFEFRSSALAKQITYLDAELMNRIEPAEMLWWAEEQDERKSPNVVAFTEHFNRVSYWVRTQVIAQADQRDREKYLLKFIKIMKQLRKMGNYNSYLAILSALDSGPLRRLDWSRAIRDQLAEHAEIMESSHSFKNYRTLLAETTPPCLPYIGLILQDLTFVHVGNPDYLFNTTPQNDAVASENKRRPEALANGTTKFPVSSPPASSSAPGGSMNKNLLNYGKRWQQFAILDNVRRFKAWPYNIERDEKVLRCFNEFSNFLPEEETWDRSFEIKPRPHRNHHQNSNNFQPSGHR